MESPEDAECLRQFAAAADLAGSVPFSVNLWKPQNLYYEKIVPALLDLQRCASQGNQEAKGRVEKLLAIGGRLVSESAATPRVVFRHAP